MQNGKQIMDYASVCSAPQNKILGSLKKKMVFPLYAGALSAKWH